MRNLKYKIKVGNIVIFLLILFLAIPMVLYMVGSTLMKMNGEWFGKEKKYYGTAIMEIYANMPKLLPTSGEDYNDVGRSYYNVVSDKHFYGDGGYSVGSLGNRKMLEKAIENFEKGVSLGGKSKYYAENLSFLINSYFIDGREEESLKLIEDAIKNENDKIRDVGLLNKIVFLVKMGQIEEGIRVCEENLDKEDFQIIYLNLLKNYGDYNDYNNAVDKYTKVQESYYRYYGIGTFLGNIDFSISNRYEKRESGDKSVRGRMTKGGVGVPYAEITLSNEYDSSSNEFDSRTVYTDRDGYYRIDNLSKNTYSVNIKVTAYALDGAYIISSSGDEESRYLQMIDISGVSEYEQNFSVRDYVVLGEEKNIIYKEDDNLVFNVPKVDGTKKVEIHIIQGGYGMSYISDIKNDDDFKISMHLVNGAQILNGYPLIEGVEGENNEEYLGIYKKEESEFYISFQYLDENGKIIKATAPGELKYKYKRDGLNEGEKLILDGKIDEAIKWNEEQLVKKGDSREYLYYLLKYYGEDSFTNKDRRKMEKFNEYYKRLEALGIESLEKNFFKGWASVSED